MNRSQLIRTWLAGLLLLAALTGTALAGPGDVGTPAADFTLQVFGGGSYTLSQNSGQVILIFVMGFG